MGAKAKLDDFEMRSDESYAFTIDASTNGSSPTVNSVEIYAHTDFTTDLSSSLLSGSSSVSGDTITTPLVTGLTDGTRYRLEVNYSLSGNTIVDYIDITCDDRES